MKSITDRDSQAWADVIGLMNVWNNRIWDNKCPLVGRIGACPMEQMDLKIDYYSNELEF